MRDVIVVGAGFAGLAAATALESQGRSVLVLEARDRIGGKVDSGVDELGHRVDLGGQWICDDMDEVLALASLHGLTLVEPDRTGRPIAHPVGDFDTIDAAFDDALGIAAAEPDGVSFGDVARRLPAAVSVGVRATAQSTMCVDPDRIPGWHIADVFERAPLTVDELQYHLAETMHELALRMAATLVEPVRTGARVTAIERHADRVVVTTTTPLEARHVVLAMPPQVVPGVAHRPALPDDVATACAAFAAGQVTKVLLRYERPFWNDVGLEGTVKFTDPTSMYVSATTNSATGPGLVAFVGGPLAERVRGLDAVERRATILGLLADALGPAALDPISWVERDWTPDDLGAGGYQSVVVDATARDAHDTLRRGLGRVHFACTEIAERFPGYIEGAIRSGHAAAGDIAAQLANGA